MSFQLAVASIVSKIEAWQTLISNMSSFNIRYIVFVSKNDGLKLFCSFELIGMIKKWYFSDFK
jgi:hypothetical protein